MEQAIRKMWKAELANYVAKLKLQILIGIVKSYKSVWQNSLAVYALLKLVHIPKLN